MRGADRSIGVFVLNERGRTVKRESSSIDIFVSNVWAVLDRDDRGSIIGGRQMFRMSGMIDRDALGQRRIETRLTRSQMSLLIIKD